MSTPERDPPLEPGTFVGPYVVEAVLGAGMFGTVYAARHPVIESRVAIKVLHRQYCADADMVARFIDEARAAGAIAHPSIVTIFDFGRLPDGRPYSVMEQLRGQALDERLADGARLDPAEALPILHAIANALEAAHRAGVAHRDVKPANIFLCSEGPAKLLDFGVAKLLDMASDAERTGTGVAIGTPAYMAPEQCLGQDVGPAADVYSLGVLAFRMLAGRLPHEAPTAVGQMAAHLNDPAPRLHRVRRGIPPAASRAIGRMLAKDAARRLSPVDAIAALEAGLAARARWPLAALALVGVSAVAYAVITPNTPATTDAAVAPARAMPLDQGASPDATPPDAGPRDAAPTPPDAGPVTLQLRRLPRGARVQIAGVDQVLDGDRIRLPHGTAAVELRISAPGHAPRAIAVRPNIDGAVDAALTPRVRRRPPRMDNPDAVDDW